MHTRPHSFLRAVGKGALLTPLLWMAPAHAQPTPDAATTAANPATTATATTATAARTVNSINTGSAVMNAQNAAARTEMPATPNLKVHNVVGLKTAVVSATDTDGNLQHAKRALMAANIALGRTPGYALMPVMDVAGLLKERKLSYPFNIPDYQQLDKKGKIKRALVVTLNTGAVGADSANHTALIEMFDTASGGLVGRGEGAFTATPANTTTDTADAMPGTDEMELRAIDGAIFSAVDDMMQPAQLNGIVVTRPQGYQVRISLGEIGGLRNGSQIEYLGTGGQAVAYGTVINLGRGEALATVAPERAYPQIYVNMPFRTVSIPSAGRAGPTQTQLDDREWDKFERDFGTIGLVAAGVYLLVR